MIFEKCHSQCPKHRKAAEFIIANCYEEHWDLEKFPAGWVDRSTWSQPLEGSPKNVR